MSDAARREIARLTRSLWLLGAAGLFFLASAAVHLVTTGGLRFIDIVVPLWALLFAGYLKRLRAARARADRASGHDA